MAGLLVSMHVVLKLALHQLQVFKFQCTTCQVFAWN